MSERAEHVAEARRVCDAAWDAAIYAAADADATYVATLARIDLEYPDMSTERDDQIAEARRVCGAAYQAAYDADADADATYHATLARINKDHPA